MQTNVKLCQLMLNYAYHCRIMHINVEFSIQIYKLFSRICICICELALEENLHFIGCGGKCVRIMRLGKLGLLTCHVNRLTIKILIPFSDDYFNRLNTTQVFEWSFYSSDIRHHSITGHWKWIVRFSDVSIIRVTGVWLHTVVSYIWFLVSGVWILTVNVS